MLIAIALLACVAALVAPGAAAAHCGDGMVHRINALRASRGVGPLQPSAALDRSAERYSRWMINHDYFGHRARIRASRHFSPLGEVLSIHAGYSRAVGPTVAAWAASPGHAAVLLSPSFKYIGTGRQYGQFNGQPMTTWVVHVGAA